MAIDLAFQNAYDEDSDIVKLLLEHYNKCNNVPKKLSTFLNFQMIVKYIAENEDPDYLEIGRKIG